MSKTLIAYYSRSGQNYVSGSIRDLAVGNAETIAGKIAERTGADVFRIETVKDYPADYYACTDVAQSELNENARPELAADADVSGYGTVILIYPNWWGTMPMCVYTFLEGHDFSGKAILPVCTHEGSGLSGTERDIARACPGASVGRGLAVKGSQAPSSDTDIERWLEEVAR